MSQRESGYERIERDRYETPEWVTRALLPHLGNIKSVWEPAAGSGKMARVLEAATASPIERHISRTGFLAGWRTACRRHRDHPPYTSAALFIEHALQTTNGSGKVAMLLRTDFDHAKTRWHLFSGCPAFARKIVLTKRIQWFENSTGSPSFNHAWYIWNHQHAGKPTLEYDLQHWGKRWKK